MDDSSSSRIAAGLREWIAAAPPGARLPSTRELVARYQAGPGTVQNALRRLSTQGLIESRPGVGTFTRSARTARPADYGWQTAALGTPPARSDSVPAALRTAANDLIALQSGYPDPELMPQRLVRAALTRAARTGAALSRPPVAGLPELQSWFAGELGAVTAAGLSPPRAADVIVLPGSQSGLSSAFRALAGAGQPVLLESPTYWGAILAARQAGAVIVPVPSGPDGPDPAALARAFRETGARLFYAQPDFANPTGAQWSAVRKEEVLRIVREHGAFLLEDDWAHDFGISGTPSPVAALDDRGHVVYLRSLTKSVSPAIRVAAIIARGPARDRLLADSSAVAMYVSGLLQAAALDVVSQPAWSTHRRGLRHQLAARRDLLLTALREHAPAAVVRHVPPGGLNLWARLPDGTDVPRLVADSERAGLVLNPGTDWFPAEPEGPYLRLNYAGPNPAAFPQAARILGRLLDPGSQADPRA